MPPAPRTDTFSAKFLEVTVIEKGTTLKSAMSDKCPTHVRRNPACPICARVSRAERESELAAPSGSPALLTAALRVGGRTWPDGTKFKVRYDDRRRYCGIMPNGFEVTHLPPDMFVLENEKGQP